MSSISQIFAGKLRLRNLVLLTCLGFALPRTGQAQERKLSHASEISFGFNHIDRNLRYEHILDVGRHEFKLGLKYILTYYPRDDQGFSYRGRAKPANLGEHFGLNASYNFRFLEIGHRFSAYAFYDVQASYTSLISKSYGVLGYVYDSTTLQSSYLYTRIVQSYPPALFIEQNIGAGFRYPITHRLVIDQAVGLGVCMARADFLWNGKRRYFWYDPIFPYVRIGLIWKWGKEN